MKRKNRKILTLIACILTLLFSSCGNSSHQNFQKKKYLKLKNKSSIEAKPIADVESDEENCLTYTENNEEIIVTESYDDIENQEQFNEPLETTYNEEIEVFKEVNKEQVKTNEKETVNTAKKKRRDFNSLSKIEQERAVIDFNRLFNNGLGILLTALVLLGIGIAIILAFSNTIFYATIVFCVSGLFFIIAWIISMIATNRVKKLRLGTIDNSRLKTKIILARVMAAIGVLATLFPLLWGAAIILFILWATKTI